ncbi:pantetheine-phosphate adenylyltransferase, partial [bacterium]
MNKCAVYPGTFDPITNGHLDIVVRAAKLFSKIIVAVGENPEKTPLFTHNERFELVKRAISELKLPNVSVGQFTGLLAQYAQDVGATAIIRG